MKEFSEKIKRHSEHIANVGHHCTTEETTKQALILPLLDILGFSPYDPTRVKAEYSADFPGAKSNERVDYALFCNGVPVMLVEAKPFGARLTNHAPQLARYFNATPEVAVSAITNGQEWRFFTDLGNKNMMDSDPFLTVDFSSLDDSQISRLRRFMHDEFQPEALRTLAEESVFLESFKSVIRNSVLPCDQDFVRFVVGKSAIQRTLTARFLESAAPIVAQAVALSMSEMVANSLAPQASVQTIPQESSFEAPTDIVDPDNPKIVTTQAEQNLFLTICDILGGEVDLIPKDTESYFSVLYKGKVNRWLVRYYAEKKNPAIQIIVPITPERKREIERAGLETSGDRILLSSPEHIMRISGILRDTLDYCRKDENFKRQSSTGEA